MSKTIDDVSLLELVPPNLQTNPDVIAVGCAIDKQWQKLANKIKYVLTYVDIDNASSKVVDMLAVELNVDFYDQSLPLATRCTLVKNGYKYKVFKGTAWAVEQAVDNVFADTYIREWFNYDGEPYHFEAVVAMELPDEATTNRIIAVINKTKNVRSVLDKVVGLAKETLQFYAGIACLEYTHEEIPVENPD